MITNSAPDLTLRPWRVADVAALVEAHRDPVLRSRTAVPIDTEDDGLRWIRAQEQGWAAADRFAFAVLETGSSRLVGHVVLKDAAAGSPTAQVGYWTVVQARGRGVATRALDALTAWAFDTFRGDGPHRLELLHQADNPASCRVAEKSGFALDRILPAAPPAYPLDGHLHVRHADC
ncbi:MAG TPA: GNAT family N-acetyltransferase [Actinoplanes sp.]|nr:GNAT family N-acetyltransferase [Actinoplanes sp.]